MIDIQYISIIFGFGLGLIGFKIRKSGLSQRKVSDLCSALLPEDSDFGGAKELQIR